MMIDREKVARALFRAKFHPDEDAATVAAKWTEWREDREAAFKDADAAISAVLEQLREPSEAMRRAGANAITTYPHNMGHRRDEAWGVWQAMLEAAFLQPQDSSNPAE